MRTFLMNRLRGRPMEFAVRKLYARLILRDATLVRNAGYDWLAAKIMRKHLRRDSNCVDVGCNEGSILKHMIRCAPQGRHIAFEPIPALHKRLRETFPGVDVLDIALSDREGEADFDVVAKRPAYSGFGRRNVAEAGEPVQRIKVRTRRLDNVIAATRPVHLLKVDVEGAELKVFRGAVKTLERDRPVVLFEHGGDCDDGRASLDIFEVLNGVGLRVSLLSRWLREQPPLTREQFLERITRHGDFFFVAS